MARFNHSNGRALAVDGAEIYFEITGDERGRPLVLLHGGMGNIEDFNSFIAPLGEFRLIGIDSRGHGASTLGNAPLTYERLEKDLTAVLDHLSLARTTVLGFSDGGIVAYRLAIHQPSRVERLITIGAPNNRSEDTVPILERVTVESWNQKFPGTQPLYQRLNRQPDFAAFVAASKKLWLDESPAGYPGGAVKGIRCPTLLVRGDADHLFSLAEAAELRTLIRDSQLLHLPNAGHVAFDDSREMCLLGVRQFLGAPAA
jgi:pimeloyl-ACP methyl ester carboxylesterase